MPTDTPTLTPSPTDTPLPTVESSPVPTADLESGVSFTKQDGSPTYEINTVHTDAGCNWLGVAGQIFDIEGIPVSGILIDAGGTLEDQEISGLSLSGTAPAYGEGGYGHWDRIYSTLLYSLNNRAPVIIIVGPGGIEDARPVQ